jgi:hypothetical protein
MGLELIQTACWRRKPACTTKRLDLRQCVLASVGNGMTRRQGAERFTITMENVGQFPLCAILVKLVQQAPR